MVKCKVYCPVDEKEAEDEEDIRQFSEGTEICQWSRFARGNSDSQKEVDEDGNEQGHESHAAYCPTET
jgi:hypothetical protein